jgi:hypothetical protein
MMDLSPLPYSLRRIDRESREGNELGDTGRNRGEIPPMHRVKATPGGRRLRKRKAHHGSDYERERGWPFCKHKCEREKNSKECKCEWERILAPLIIRMGVDASAKEYWYHL